eukprot:jgi/Chlat1/5863/Chrsp4S06239
MPSVSDLDFDWKVADAPKGAAKFKLQPPGKDDLGDDFLKDFRVEPLADDSLDFGSGGSRAKPNVNKHKHSAYNVPSLEPALELDFGKFATDLDIDLDIDLPKDKEKKKLEPQQQGPELAVAPSLELVVAEPRASPPRVRIDDSVREVLKAHDRQAMELNMQCALTESKAATLPLATAADATDVANADPSPRAKECQSSAIVLHNVGADAQWQPSASHKGDQKLLTPIPEEGSQDMNADNMKPLALPSPHSPHEADRKELAWSEDSEDLSKGAAGRLEAPPELPLLPCPGSMSPQRPNPKPLPPAAEPPMHTANPCQDMGLQRQAEAVKDTGEAVNKTSDLRTRRQLLPAFKLAACTTGLQTKLRDNSHAHDNASSRRMKFASPLDASPAPVFASKAAQQERPTFIRKFALGSGLDHADAKRVKLTPLQRSAARNQAPGGHAVSGTANGHAHPPAQTALTRTGEQRQPGPQPNPEWHDGNSGNGRHQQPAFEQRPEQSGASNAAASGHAGAQSGHHHRASAPDRAATRPHIPESEPIWDDDDTNSRRFREFEQRLQQMHKLATQTQQKAMHACMRASVLNNQLALLNRAGEKARISFTTTT